MGDGDGSVGNDGGMGGMNDGSDSGFGADGSFGDPGFGSDAFGGISFGDPTGLASVFGSEGMFSDPAGMASWGFNADESGIASMMGLDVNLADPEALSSLAVNSMPNQTSAFSFLNELSKSKAFQALTAVMAARGNPVGLALSSTPAKAAMSNNPAQSLANMGIQTALGMAFGLPGQALGVLGNMTGLTNSITSAFNNTNSPPSFMGNEGNNGVLSGLAGMYAANRGYRDSQGMLEGLQGLYSQDSPYSQALRQQLQRKDAAGGRRSQYGPREVELQARLAQMASNQIPAMNQLSQRANMNRAIMLQQGLGAFNSMGGMNYLRDLFRGPSSLSQTGSAIPGMDLNNLFGDLGLPDIPVPSFGG